MSINLHAYKDLTEELAQKQVILVAVSKLKPPSDIRQLYELGHRDFGENYVQELVDKKERLPADINWHFIGHLQSNKVKYIAPFINLIHSVDTGSLLREINKQAKKNDRIIDVLLQLYIATEESKFGLSEEELTEIVSNRNLYPNVRIRGIMAMASFSPDENLLREEFSKVKEAFEKHKDIGWTILSTGMTNDYKLAIEEGSNMVRIGSLIFGNRGKE